MGAAYARGELSEEEEALVCEYLLLEATEADLRDLERRARLAPPGARAFEFCMERIERLDAAVATVVDTAVEFLRQTILGTPVAAMLDQAAGELADGEVVSVRVAARGPDERAAVFVRRDHGAPEIVKEWTPLGAPGVPMEVVRYGLDEGEDRAELLVVVVPGSAALSEPDLRLLAEHPSARWGMRAVCRRGT